MGRGNFTKVENYIFQEGRYLTPNAKLVYIVLCSFRNNKTGKTFPSYGKIMEKSGLGRNKVADALYELERFYWITRKKVFIGGNHYSLQYPWNVQRGLSRECPTKDEAKQFSKMIRDTKRRYGVNPFEKEEVEEYDEPEEWDDSEIPF